MSVGAAVKQEISAVNMPGSHAGQQWRARQRDILNRIVRETDPPTGSLPRITESSQKLDAAYSARVGEVLDLAGSIGAILMASGMPATATMENVTAITLAYGLERCEVDVINTTIHVSAYRGPTAAPASTLHIVQSRSMDFSRLAAVDRLITRIRAGELSPRRPRVTNSTPSPPRHIPTSGGSPPLPGGVRSPSPPPEPSAPACSPASSVR